MVLIQIYDGRRNTYSERHALKKKGFRFVPEPKAHWCAEVSERDIPDLEDWCFSKGLEIETPYSKRSSDYRKVFFEAFASNWFRGGYLCAYCGIPLSKERVTVDHLVSVKRAQRSRYYLRMLRKWGCESVNDARNLVPCCKRCNSRKGTKAGLWVLRGRIGVHKLYWHFIWALELIFLFGGAAFLWYCLVDLGLIG